MLPTKEATINAIKAFTEIRDKVPFIDTTMLCERYQVCAKCPMHNSEQVGAQCCLNIIAFHATKAIRAMEQFMEETNGGKT